MVQIPVYAFTGFLDSGKTKFIQETLEDERFNAGERTLLLVFEEGEEEFDFSTYPHQNVFLEVLDQETVTEKDLKALVKKHRPERIVAELNGMQLVGDLYARFPAEWAIAQEVMFADSTTFMTYNANMRNLVMDKLTGAQMVVFNRLPLDADVMPFHKLARAASRRIDIMYEFTDGSTQFSGKRIYRSPTCCMPFSSATTRSALYFFCREASCLVVTVCWSRTSSQTFLAG